MSDDPADFLSKLPLPAAVAASKVLRGRTKICDNFWFKSSLVELCDVDQQDWLILSQVGFVNRVDRTYANGESVECAVRWVYRDPEYKHAPTILLGILADRPPESTVPAGTMYVDTETQEIFMNIHPDGWIRM